MRKMRKTDREYLAKKKFTCWKCNKDVGRNQRQCECGATLIEAVQGLSL